MRVGNGPRTTDYGPRGLTLIELLVVIVILTTIVAAAIPILTPSNDDRRIREASRGVNAFITGAQMKAVELRRPFGVALKRLSIDTGNAQDNAVCQALFYVEQPPAYTGFDESSAARVAFYVPEVQNPPLYGGLRPLVLIQFVTRGNGVAFGVDGLPFGWDPDLLPSNVVRPGDVIEFGGTRYELLSDTTDPGINTVLDPTKNYFDTATGQVSSDHATQIVARPLNDSGQMINATHDDYGNEIASGFADFRSKRSWTYPASYKILRQPMPTAAEPYQMPEGTAIDLRASGVGNDDFFYVPNVHDNAATIVILFAPEGSVSRVSFGQQPDDPVSYDQPVTDNVLLLVGRSDIIPAPAVAQDKTLDSSTLPAPAAPNRDQLMEELRDPVNWLRGESRWIAIGPQSGRVVTTENAAVDPLVIINKFAPPLSESSKALRDEQIKAARKFARQMSQMGGG
jgi:prepilin-type N-terminal cleavage/methylation domain-containing protein